jgi:proline racemase
LGDVRDVEITVPGYGDVVVDVALGGSFYLIDESTDGIVPISSNGS